MGTYLSPAGDVDGDGYADLITCRLMPDGHSETSLYRGSPTGPSPTPDWTYPGGGSDGQACIPYQGVGDVNGDGFDDVALGAEVYYGSAGGLPSTPSWIGQCDQPSAGLGGVVAGPGDLNHDGYDDVALGAKSYFVASSPEPGWPSGAMFVFFGSATGLAPTPGWTVFGSGYLGTFFPDRLAAAGDVDGDGIDDLLVEGISDIPGSTGGFSQVFCGEPAPAVPTSCWFRSRYGHFLGGARSTPLGDVDGDGFGDLMLSTASDAEPGQPRNWTTHVCHGSATGTHCVAWGSQDLTTLPIREGVGDTDGDGFDELLEGFPTDAGGAGRVALYRGSAAGLPVQPEWTVDGTQGRLGAYLANMGDLNGNGLADFAVAAPRWTNPEVDEGAIFVFFDPNRAPVALCNALVVEAAGNGCVAAVAPSAVDAGSFDPEGDAVTLELDPAGPFPLGRTAVTLTARDGSGLPGRCAAEIEVRDDQDGPCELDNCPGWFNPDQVDADGDGLGDVCDPCPLDSLNDVDGDGLCESVDNCASEANADQADADGDAYGDVCDPCPLDAMNDTDSDGVCGDFDNCPTVPNSDQADSDVDGIGDACDCPATPALGCTTGFGKGLLVVNEKKSGKEMLIAHLLQGPALTQADFGNPLSSGGTFYDLCIYDDHDALVGQIAVHRAGDTCAGDDCWNPTGDDPPSGKGYLYKDTAAAADGTTLIKLKGGDAGKSRVIVVGHNKARQDETSLPTGIAPALSSTTSATVQVRTSDAGCFTKTFADIVKQRSDLFKAK